VLVTLFVTPPSKGRDDPEADADDCAPNASAGTASTAAAPTSRTRRTNAPVDADIFLPG
jgi:hypothetical protein